MNRSSSCHHQHQQLQRSQPPIYEVNNQQISTPSATAATITNYNHSNNNRNCPRNAKRFSNSSSNSNGSNNSGNGTANGAATISYTRQRKDSIKSNHSCHALDGGDRLTSSASKTMSAKSSRRKNSIGCLTALSSSPSSPGCYYCIG